MKRLLGVTVMPEWAQAEGVDAVLDRLQAAGVNAIATSPYVMAPTAEGEGGREPPIDAGAGKVRLLDRPLWGARERWCRTAPSYEPDLRHYAGLRYQPAAPDALTAAEGPTVRRFLDTAKARGMTVQLQVQAAIPPGYRVQFGGGDPEDEPRLPTGSALGLRVDKNASLASPHVRAYLQALLRDLAAAYPMIDAVRVDWPEYPPYTLEACFTDFSAHAIIAMNRLGYDVGKLRRDAGEALSRLHAGVDLSAVRAPDGGRFAFATALRHRPGVLDLMRFKADLVVELLGAARTALPGGIGLIPQAFPPPWTLASGFDVSRAAAIVQGIGVKLYTMHWPMMARFYAEALGGSPDAARAVPVLLDIDMPTPGVLTDLRYPEPEEAHPVGGAAQRRKLDQALAAAETCPVFAFAHAYGPEADMIERFRIAWDAPVAGVWLNRYGYLSDAKIAGIGRVASGESAH